MVLRSDDTHIVFVSVDFVGVEKRMVADIAERVARHGIREHELVVGATHTHSGPGTISRRPSLALVAVDRFRRENYEAVLDRIVESIDLAVADLQPAELVTGEFETEGLQRNKFRRQDEQHFDRRARFLLAREPATGRLRGGLLNYALHGNGMPVSDLRFSSDTLGSIANNVEAALAEAAGSEIEPVMLYLNGAEGDVGNRERSVEAVAADGETFAAQLLSSGVLDRLEPVAPVIGIERARVWLGLPGYSLRNCFGNPAGKPGLDVRLPLWLMQQRTWVSVLHVGEISMLTWPGEPSVQVGYNTQAQAEDAGYPDSWILGLTNDYQSYFTTRDEYYEGAYDSCSSLFRWRGGQRIQKALMGLMKGTNNEVQQETVGHTDSAVRNGDRAGGR